MGDVPNTPENHSTELIGGEFRLLRDCSALNDAAAAVRRSTLKLSRAFVFFAVC